MLNAFSFRGQMRSYQNHHGDIAENGVFVGKRSKENMLIIDGATLYVLRNISLLVLATPRVYVIYFYWWWQNCIYT